MKKKTIRPIVQQSTTVFVGKMEKFGVSVSISGGSDPTYWTTAYGDLWTAAYGSLWTEQYNTEVE